MNQALSGLTPRQCSLPALRIWQQKQMDPIKPGVAERGVALFSVRKRAVRDREPKTRGPPGRSIGTAGRTRVGGIGVSLTEATAPAAARGRRYETQFAR